MPVETCRTRRLKSATLGLDVKSTPSGRPLKVRPIEGSGAVGSPATGPRQEESEMVAGVEPHQIVVALAVDPVERRVRMVGALMGPERRHLVPEPGDGLNAVKSEKPAA